MKQCGTCTKCCDGSLTATIRDHDMYPGKPCFFVQLGKGCGDYDNRPDDPCKSYKCLWLDNMHMPEEFKPERSGTIVNFNKLGNLHFLWIVKAPNNPSEELLKWVMDYCISNKLNLRYDIDDKIHYMGSEEFIEVMNG